MPTLALHAFSKAVSDFEVGYYKLTGTYQRTLLESTDTTDLHGGLLALAQLSIAYDNVAPSQDVREKDMRRVSVFSVSEFISITNHRTYRIQIFECLSVIPHTVLVGTRNEIITAAACELIALTVTLTEIELHEASSVPNWRKVLDHGSTLR